MKLGIGLFREVWWANIAVLRYVLFGGTAVSTGTEKWQAGFVSTTGRR